MVQIVADAQLPQKLAALKTVAEVVDPAGRVLGEFIPSGPLFMTVEEARKLGLCPFTDEELAIDIGDPPRGRPLADILRDLENQ